MEREKKLTFAYTSLRKNVHIYLCEAEETLGEKILAKNTFRKIPTPIKRVLQILLILLAVSVIMQKEQKPLVKGIWVVRTTLQSKDSIIEMLERVEKANLTDILAQVNMSGYAYYRSERLPLAVTGFDPLHFLLEEAHKKGLKVHAWVNAFTVGPLGAMPQDPNHVLYMHPKWSTVDANGVSVLEYPRSSASEALPTQYLEPGLKEVQDWVIENCLEIVQKYPVDGIHLDFLRYPDSKFGYHPEVVESFHKEFGFSLLELSLNEERIKAEFGESRLKEATQKFNQFRRDQITRVIEEVYSGTKKIRRDTLVSASVYPDQKEAKNEKFQDWFKWLEEGSVDFATPMLYTPDFDTFHDKLHELEERVDPKKVLVGLGSYQDTLGGTLSKIDILTEDGFAGYLLFSYDAIKDSTILDRLSNED